MSGNDEVAVFFYGLFMDESLLIDRGITASRTQVGFVDGYRLKIGARATLIAEPGHRAYGVLMNIRRDDAVALYSEESVADYVAETVLVNLRDGVTESAVCYNLPRGKLTGTNTEYARSLLLLASTLAFPDDYLEAIRAEADPLQSDTQ